MVSGRAWRSRRWGGLQLRADPPGSGVPYSMAEPQLGRRAELRAEPGFGRARSRDPRGHCVPDAGREEGPVVGAMFLIILFLIRHAWSPFTMRNYMALGGLGAASLFLMKDNDAMRKKLILGVVLGGLSWGWSSFRGFKRLRAACRGGPASRTERHRTRPPDQGRPAELVGKTGARCGTGSRRDKYRLK